MDLTDWIKWKIRNFAVWLKHATSDFVIPHGIYDGLSDTSIDKNDRADKAIDFCRRNRWKYSGSRSESDFAKLEALSFLSVRVS